MATNISCFKINILAVKHRAAALSKSHDRSAYCEQSSRVCLSLTLAPTMDQRFRTQFSYIYTLITATWLRHYTNHRLALVHSRTHMTPIPTPPPLALTSPVAGPPHVVSSNMFTYIAAARAAKASSSQYTYRILIDPPF